MMAYNYPFYQQQQPMASFVSVRSEAEARNYPVAYGNSVTFKDETAPYIYSKTMGYSQLDRPVFEKYKLIKEEAQEPNPEPKMSEASNSALDELKAEIGRIWSEIDVLKKEVGDESAV